jgi:hypothetical protein
VWERSFISSPYAEFKTLLFHKPMAKILGIVTLVIMLASGYVAYKNKALYETEIANNATEVDRRNATQVRLQRAVTALNALEERRGGINGLEAEIAGLTKDEAAQKELNESLKKQIKEKTDIVGATKVELDALREKITPLGDPNDLISKGEAADKKRKELTQRATDHEAKLAGLTASNKEAEVQSAALKSKLDLINNSKSLPTLVTRIRNIYPSWGFVTIQDGMNHGVVGGSHLDVVRDGAVIAKLLVSAVERNTASASIVPESLAPDTVLMVGDKVVSSGSSSQPQVANDKGNPKESSDKPAASKDPFAADADNAQEPKAADPKAADPFGGDAGGADEE